MDFLGGLSVETLGMLVWVVTAVMVLILATWRRRQLAAAGLAGTILFAVLNAGAGIYVLSHLGDARWGSTHSPLNAPDFPDGSLLGATLDPLESSLESVVGGINGFIAFKQALPIALDFFARSGWGLLASIIFLIWMAGSIFKNAKTRRQELENLKNTVMQLKADLAATNRSVLPSQNEAGPAAKNPAPTVELPTRNSRNTN